MPRTTSTALQQNPIPSSSACQSNQGNYILCYLSSDRRYRYSISTYQKYINCYIHFHFCTHYANRNSPIISQTPFHQSSVVRPIRLPCQITLPPPTTNHYQSTAIMMVNHQLQFNPQIKAAGLIVITTQLQDQLQIYQHLLQFTTISLRRFPPTQTNPF